ncbi:MAG: glycosyltransferase family 2 protein [Candidatus Altiarchaeota archaeon]|nr:glycosyltransferase family 2 protein [Candidatus Altiarchaeota archaeon]
MKISVIIPAYNEGPRIGGVLEGIPGGVDEVVVVDDGSDDDTGGIATAMGARVIRHEKNKGKGNAIKTGILKSKNEVLVFMDGDGQHDPRYITKIVKPLLKDDADVVIGNRFHNGFSGTPAHRIISNTLTRSMINIITKEGVKDPLSGYRAITRGAIEELQLDGNGFEIEIELILQAIERGYRISYVNVPLIYGVKKSHLRNLDSIKITLRLINAFVKYRLCGL